MWVRIREEGAKQEDSTTIKSGEVIAHTKGSISFGPIDAFHLADLNVLRGRITKLLLNSPDHTHVTKDLVITLVSFRTLGLNVTLIKNQRDSKTRPKRNVGFSAPG